MLMAEQLLTDTPTAAVLKVRFLMVTDVTLSRLISVPEPLPAMKVPEVLLPTMGTLLMGVIGPE